MTAIHPRIVETAANAIRSISYSYSSDEFPALKQLLTYSDNALIFQAIMLTTGNYLYTPKSTSLYFLPELVKRYCYFGSLGLHFSSAGMKAILSIVGDIEARKFYKIIFQSVAWHANLDEVTNYIH